MGRRKGWLVSFVASDHTVTGRRITPTDYNGLVEAIDGGFDSVAVASSPFVTPEQFGAVGDGTTNDGAAFAAAIAYLKANARVDADSTIYKGSQRLKLDAKHYYLGTTTLDITHTLIIEGEGSGKAGGHATKLRWAANTTGIRVQRYNTSGASTVDGVTHHGGDGTIIRGLHLRGAFTDIASEGEYHAIHAKARITAEDVFCDYWQGDGFYSVTDSDSGTATEGNSNCLRLSTFTAWYCRNGIYLGDADANAGLIEDYDCSYNRRFGWVDNSHIGNVWLAGHTDGNGISYTAADNIPTMVTYNGRRFTPVYDQAAGASTNAPPNSATDNTWWIYCYDGGAGGNVVPTWTNGITVRSGGPWVVWGHVGTQATIIGSYSEPGQAKAQGRDNALCIGKQGADVAAGITYLISNAGALYTRNAITTESNFTAGGAAQTFGPTSGATLNQLLLRSGTGGSRIGFQSGSGSDGGIVVSPGGAMFLGAVGTVTFRSGSPEVDVFTYDSAGVNLASGKVLKVNGTQVVSSRGAAVADASGGGTVDTEARAAINALLARCRAHGLIAT